VKTKLMLTLAGSALAIVALAGCSSPTTAPPADDSGSTSAPSDQPAAALDATTVTTSLGEIVVDGQGMTAYYFDKDTPDSGSSACTDACATLWPAIESSSETPNIEGITGEVATITGVDGGNQITINGRPIYTYAQDAAPGDVNGQGFKDVWWVVSPSGEELKAPAGDSGY
jgi:predicted lipoprotein with Yx(FWY)xxD motif